MPWEGLNQRAFPRVTTQCDLIIHDRIGGTIKAKTQNLGLGGLCVLLDRSLEKLSQVHLRLALTKANPPVECDGRIVWMVRTKEPVASRPTFDIGIEFLNLKLGDKDQISSFIGHA
ncbi:MAG: hypothetical protein A3C35_06960 [Omnitrophica bacterium RIFCSPHIGHO2_02_FULL_46_11]|nr:MAG: hypothetical protein A3A81_06890 [Omnitrophica bacterium RIFCSPLOWO2_01_FULL_45_10b]OGW87225.1 MAG: hypothetical protein A3C35_06960 [Omnitrophica bacterium RIFCSPHIGHO2_02_FULL_46_11]